MNAYATNARRLTIWFTLISTFVVLTLLPFSKVSFAYHDLGHLSYLFASFFALSVYCWKRKMFRLASSLEALAIGVFMTVPILISTYLAASLDMPLMDAPLMRADAALGLHWVAFIQFVDAHPAFAEILAKAYSSLGIQLLMLPLILGATGRHARTYVMILSYGVLCYVSSFISIWFPALGTYSVYGIMQEQLHDINAYYGFAFLHDFNAVREQAEFTLSAANASGIVTFPSVHAACALLCAWAAWDLKPVRYPLIAWNILMGISAISHANHYLVDVIAGVAIGSVSIYLVSEVLHRMQQAQWTVLPPSAVWALVTCEKQSESRPSTLP
ncbi:phosphatase PAP2 family protein [Mesorhizobium shangrilense]|uniref:Phosphatase PAP2 family protein n=1 Tax=Mesorhizobium shangrilense TaxID=460060 RepID=A0ABV2DHG2_9HYPH